MQVFRKRKFVNHILTFSIFFFMFNSCAYFSGQIKYPDTPIGQAALLIGGYHDQVDLYIQDVSWATDPNHVDMLEKRLRAITLADANFKEIADRVKRGETIPEALLRSTHLSLNELKRWLYTQQAVTPSKADVEKALEKAHIKPEASAQGWESIVILLIELIQSFAPMMDRLVQMGKMSPEEVQAEFDFHYAWVKTFSPAELPRPGSQ